MKNLALDSEDEPSPMNYENLPSARKNKVGLNDYNQKKINTDKNSTEKEVVKMNTDRLLSKNKLKEEIFEEPKGTSLKLTENPKNYQNLKYDIDKENNSTLNEKKNSSIDYENDNQISEDDLLDSKDYNDMEMIEDDEIENQITPNPTVSIMSKRESQIKSGSILGNLPNLNNLQDNNYYPKMKSEKSVGVLSDTSVRPRKGDMTPKSHETESIEHLENQEEEINSIKENLNENFDKMSIKNSVKNSVKSSVKKSLPPTQIDDNNNLDPIDQVNALNQLIQNSNLKLTKQHLMNKTNTSQISTDKNFNQYDVQQLSYDLVKEYSHLKINKDEDFLRRMLFDVFKRQTKDERMNKLIEKNKVKIDETERIKTFNRLIEDANRRLEAQEKIEMMKNKLNENSIGTQNKKYKFEEWEEIYEERFLKPNIEKEKKIEQKMVEKFTKEKEMEEEILDMSRTKKAPQHVINQTVKRMYEEAERRKLKMDEYRRRDSEEEKAEEDEFKKEREMTPSKFQKYKNVQKYNFMVN